MALDCVLLKDLAKPVLSPYAINAFPAMAMNLILVSYVASIFMGK